MRQPEESCTEVPREWACLLSLRNPRTVTQPSPTLSFIECNQHQRGTLISVVDSPRRGGTAHNEFPCKKIKTSEDIKIRFERAIGGFRPRRGNRKAIFFKGGPDSCAFRSGPLLRYSSACCP